MPRYTDKQKLGIIRDIDEYLGGGNTISEACDCAGIATSTYYKWCDTVNPKDLKAKTETPQETHNGDIISAIQSLKDENDKLVKELEECRKVLGIN